MAITVQASDLYVIKDSSQTFTDVHEGDVFKPAVDVITTIGVMNGVDIDKFAPSSSTTRATLATVLWRIAGQPTSDVAVPFTDLRQDWYKEAVKWAYDSGIINGTGITTFDPDLEVTRETLVTILYRFTKHMGQDVSSSTDLATFADCHKYSHWSQDALAWAVNKAVITGKLSENRMYLHPTDVASRGDIALILYRFYHRYEELFVPRLQRPVPSSEPPMTGTALGTFASGDGTKNHPYVITSASQLSAFALSVNSGNSYEGEYIRLDQSISLSGEWTPIGNSRTTPFKGNFDGCGNTVSNVNVKVAIIKKATKDYDWAIGGLFGICENATISNLKLSNVTVDRKSILDVDYIFVGGLVARMESTTAYSITNVQVESFSSVLNCRYSTYYVGGVVGSSIVNKGAQGTIDLVTANAKIELKRNDDIACLGGLAGHITNYSKTSISNVVSTTELNIPEDGVNYAAMIGGCVNKLGHVDICSTFSKVYTTLPNNETSFESWYGISVIKYEFNFAAMLSANSWDKKADFTFGIRNNFGAVYSKRGPYDAESVTPLWQWMARYTEENNRSCEVLPENHGLDVTKWDLSDLAAPKLIHRQ